MYHYTALAQGGVFFCLKMKIYLVKCNATRYSSYMIKSFKHAGLEKFFKTGSTTGIQTEHKSRLQVRLLALDTAKQPTDLAVHNWKLHPLKGGLKNHWAIWVDQTWRLTFTFEGADVVLLDYQDYH